MVEPVFKSVNAHDGVAVSRLLELFSPEAPWHRSLWGVGLALGLRELHEACCAVRTGTLSEASVRRIGAALIKRSGKDPALREPEKVFIREQLKDVPRAEGAAHHALLELAALFEGCYVERWRDALVVGGLQAPETFARGIAAHMLDAGFSNTHLKSLIKRRLGGEEIVTLNDLCDELQAQLTSHPHRDFEALLAFAKMPPMSGGIAANWLIPGQVSAWLVANRFETTHVRAAGALSLKVRARDVDGAARAVQGVSDRFAARAAIGTGQPLERWPVFWVQGATEPFSHDVGSRGVKVRALHRENLIFAETASSSVDAALELLAHLDGSSPAAAIAGGWAAIEGLLADPNDRASAADHLASLVSCSVPRAELTLLSYGAERMDDEFADALRGCASNRERSRWVARSIVSGRLSTMNRAADTAAVMRMRKLLARPSIELRAMKAAVSEAFHRLYRQRNLILHGGKLDGVALNASLRTVSKLAGAGMDRITHAQYVNGVRPLELVAKSELSMSLITEDTALTCVDLLETR